MNDLLERYRSRYFDREGKEIDLMTYGYLMELGNNVKKDLIGDFLISTVWLGLDHAWYRFADREKGLPPPVPLIFETMIFYEREPEDEEFNGYQERYCTNEEALLGHEKACEEVRKYLAKKEKK
jgi:hypothetical protein